MVKFSITNQSIKDMAVEAVTTNGIHSFLHLCRIWHCKDACSNARSTEPITYSLQRRSMDHRCISEKDDRNQTDKPHTDKMVLVEVDLCTLTKHPFIGIDLQAVVGSNL